MSPELKALTDMKWQLDCSTTSMKPSYVPRTAFTDKTANGLTRCIITWLTINGHQTERINSMGRMLDNRKRVTDVLGRSYTIGSAKYIPGTGRNGTADISATIRTLSGVGRSVKIEVKIGADKQSDAQRSYQVEVEHAGGVYLIARNFPGFIKDYKLLIDRG